MGGLALLTTGFLFAAESTSKHSADHSTDDRSGIDRANFDESVKPGQDFFLHVNGSWIEHNPIPPQYSRWGAFAKLGDDNLLVLRSILEELPNEKGPLDENRRKLRDFYITAMDQKKIDQQGITPLDDELKRIAQVDSPEALVVELGHLRVTGTSALLSCWISQDEKLSSRYMVHLWQGGLSLPDRDYYLSTTADQKRLREQYVEHVAKMFVLMGNTPEVASKAAEIVLRIETQLAEKSRPPVELRDRENQYHPHSLAELAALTPNLPWPSYFKACDLPPLEDVIVGQPDFFARVNEMLVHEPLAAWRIYLRWHLIHSAATELSEPFEQENFRFYSTVLRGTKEMQPRWKRIVGKIDGLLGEALGKLYVERAFPPESKRRMDGLVKNLLAAYRQRIEELDWMGPETKQPALEKLAKIMPKIGYPSKWIDYTTLEVKTDSYLANVVRAVTFDWHYDVNKLGKPVDRTEWGMSPPTVNAYYNEAMNEIVFPAGILQPPFFDAKADDAVNYGAIGAVIGHEITHGFDDQGSRFDAEGNLKNWWTSEDRARFTAKTDKLVKQFDACVGVDGLHVNGRLTLGENLADLGGVTIAYAAYQKSLAGKPAPVIDKFTGPQRFFIGFAQVWRGETRDAEARVLLRTDPHSPPKFRTDVTLSNIDPFYDAFEVKPGDAMYRAPQDRVKVW
jgi:putative endopeptidase